MILGVQLADKSHILKSSYVQYTNFRYILVQLYIYFILTLSKSHLLNCYFLLHKFLFKTKA